MLTNVYKPRAYIQDFTVLQKGGTWIERGGEIFLEKMGNAIDEVSMKYLVQGEKIKF